MFKRLRLNASGVAHHFALALVVVGVAIGGTYYFVFSHADTAAASLSACPSGYNYYASTKTNDGPVTNKCLKPDFNTKVNYNAKTKTYSCPAGDHYIVGDNTWCHFLTAASCPSGYTQNGGTCNKNAAPANSAPSSGGSSPGSGSTPKPPKYKVKIVASSCSNVVALAEDVNYPDHVLNTRATLTKGPYGNGSNVLSGNANMTVSGLSGSHYRKWTMPVAVQDSTTPTVVALNATYNGTSVGSAAAIIPACKTPSWDGSGSHIPAGAHQYEGHIIVGQTTCQSIAVEAHDLGSAAYKTIFVRVTLSGKAVGSNVNVDGSTTKGADGSGFTTLTVPPDTAKKLAAYKGSSPTTASLSVGVNGKVVNANGNPQTVNLIGCQKGTGSATMPTAPASNPSNKQEPKTSPSGHQNNGNGSHQGKKHAQPPKKKSSGGTLHKIISVPGKVVKTIGNGIHKIFHHGSKKTPAKYTHTQTAGGYCYRHEYLKGEASHCIADIQKVVGVKASSDYDNGTVAAVKKFQKNHGLDVDGVVGPLTWSKICNNAGAQVRKDVGCAALAQEQKVAVSTPDPSSTPSSQSGSNSGGGSKGNKSGKNKGMTKAQHYSACISASNKSAASLYSCALHYGTQSEINNAAKLLHRAEDAQQQAANREAARQAAAKKAAYNSCLKGSHITWPTFGFGGPQAVKNSASYCHQKVYGS